MSNEEDFDLLYALPDLKQMKRFECRNDVRLHISKGDDVI